MYWGQLIHPQGTLDHTENKCTSTYMLYQWFPMTCISLQTPHLKRYAKDPHTKISMALAVSLNPFNVKDPLFDKHWATDPLVMAFLPVGLPNRLL